MIYNPPGQTGGFAPVKSYNFAPDIWDGVKAPPGSSFNQEAWKREKDIKFKLTDDPRDYKKFSRTLKSNRTKKMQSLKPKKYNKALAKHRKHPRNMKQQIPEEGVLRPDLDNAIMTRTAQMAMNRDKYLNKYSIPVYKNRDKAKMNLMRTEIAAKNPRHGVYQSRKKAKKIATAAAFSSLVKRKEKNKLKSQLVDVGLEKARHTAELMRQNILDSMKRTGGNTDYDELEESDVEDYNVTEKKKHAEGKRKREHEILNTHNFQMDTRNADDYIKNILDVAGGGVPSKVDKSAPINTKWKLDDDPHFKKTKKTHLEPELEVKNFVVDSALKYKSRLNKIKARNETILKKDHAELFTKKVPNRKLKNFVEQRGGGRGGLMGVYDAYSELKKQGFKSKFLDDEQTKADRNKPKHMQKLQKKEKAKRSWKQIKNKSEQLSRVKAEIPREVANKWVNGVLRFKNVEDLLEEADSHLQKKEKQIQKELKQIHKTPGQSEESILRQNKLWADLQELKRLQEVEENEQLMEVEADMSYCEDVDYQSNSENEEPEIEVEPVTDVNQQSAEEEVHLKNVSEDEFEPISEAGEKEEVMIQPAEIEEEPEEVEGVSFSQPESNLETDEQNLEQSASNNSVQKEIIADKEPSEQVNPSPVDSVKPTVPNLDLEKPASPETEMTSVEKTNQMIKQMKKAQYEVNKTYQNQIAEVESKLQAVKQQLNHLEQPLEAEKRFYETRERSKIDQFMKDKNINVTKRRIRYGLNMIEDIKTSVIGINVNKAIDLKEDYDKIRSKQKHLEQVVPPNREFKDFYVKSWQQKRDEEQRKKEQKLQSMSRFLERKNLEDKAKQSRDKNARRFEQASSQLTDAQKSYILSNIVSEDPDLDARKDVDHPWIDFY